MDALLKLAEATLGLVLVVVALASAFRTVVLPGAAFDRLSRGTFLGMRQLLRAIARAQSHYDREAVFRVHAPAGLLLMALAWALGIIVGFGLLFHATADLSLDDAFALAGSSFTTLGFVRPGEGLPELLSISAAILGLGIVAMLLSYLPTIYGLYSRREVTVADVSIKSGGRAHGPDLLLRLSRGADTRRIDDLWADWTHWLIALGETQTSEPALVFFRSPRGQRSWLAAATAVMDAAILRNVVVDKPDSLRADMAYRAGVEAFVSLAEFFSAEPASEDDDTRLTREDFEAVVAQMDEAGMPCVEERDEAWAAFCRMRAAFEPQMLGLCRLLLPPPSEWGSDLLARPQQGQRH
jgi:hypothetical protein